MSGVVVSMDQRPIADARIEIHDARNGRAVASAHSNPSGGFEILNVPPGEYDIVATIGVLQTRERLSVGTFTSADVVLRVPFQDSSETAAAVGGEHTVSVRQLQVPQRAANELARAQRALEKDDRERAWRHVERALQRFQHFPEALTLRAVLKAGDDDLDGAIADLEQALSLDANYAMAYLVLAATFNLREQYDQALRSADRAVALAPRAWQAYFEMSKALLALGDFQAALQQIDRARSLCNEDYPAMYLVRAHALLGLEQYDAATATLQRYLAGDPEGPDAADARRMLDEVHAFRAAPR